MIFLFTLLFILPYLISVIGAYAWIRKQYNTQWRLISPSFDSLLITFTPFVNTGFTVILLIEVLMIYDDIYSENWRYRNVKRKKTKLDKFFGIKVEEY